LSGFLFGCAVSQITRTSEVQCSPKSHFFLSFNLRVSVLLTVQFYIFTLLPQYDPQLQ
jgi:hypothetical protein